MLTLNIFSYQNNETMPFSTGGEKHINLWNQITDWRIKYFKIPLQFFLYVEFWALELLHKLGKWEEGTEEQPDFGTSNQPPAVLCCREDWVLSGDTSWGAGAAQRRTFCQFTDSLLWCSPFCYSHHQCKYYKFEVYLFLKSKACRHCLTESDL